MTNRNQNQSPEPKTEETYHAVTERWRCYKMQEKYGWRLKRIEKKQSSIFKYDCVFEGDAQRLSSRFGGERAVRNCKRFNMIQNRAIIRLSEI